VREGGAVKSPIVRRCSKQGALRWTHPWPHRDGVGPRIVEGGPCKGAPAVVVGAILVFSLPLAITLTFATVVEVGGTRGSGRLRT
jgi:hypothetical protein